MDITVLKIATNLELFQALVQPSQVPVVLGCRDRVLPEGLPRGVIV